MSGDENLGERKESLKDESKGATKGAGKPPYNGPKSPIASVKKSRVRTLALW